MLWVMTTPTTTGTASDAPPRFEIVAAPASALPYVLSTWGRSLESKLEGKAQPGFLHDFALIQANIIKRSQVLCAMAGDKIVGIIVFESGVLHWISTRKEFRQRGAATQLLLAAHLGGSKPTITTWTSDLRHLRLADAPYKPFWLRT